MKFGAFAPIAALSLIIMPLAAAHADEFPLVMGNFVRVDSISIDDGHDLEYAKHLAGKWRKGQDFAVKQGWIVSYEILDNTAKRAGEPDLYLVTTFSHIPDAAEAEKRDKVYEDFMKTTMATQEAESSERAKYRHEAGSMMLRELKFRD